MRLKFIKKSTSKIVMPVLCPQSDERYSIPGHSVQTV